MNRILLTAACVASMAACHTANAISYSSSIGGAATGATLQNFDTLTPGADGLNVGTFGALTVDLLPNAKVAGLPNTGEYAAPWLSGLNGTGFGSPVQALGQDQTSYLTSGISGYAGGNPPGGGLVRLSFSTPMKYFGLLWGSVDTYNTLNFYDAGGLVYSITGTAVIANANGDQGQFGTTYVNFDMTSNPFTRVEMSSSQYAFEFDNVAYSENTLSIPDGGSTLALAGLGMLGLGLLRRKLA